MEILNVVHRTYRRRQRRIGRAELPSRRPFQAEKLESRQLLASDFHNLVNPYDVNVDGSVAPVDAVIVLSDMRRHGIRALTASAGSDAEGEGSSSKMMVDVNGDGFLTPLDALQVLRGLAEGAAGDPQVQYRLFMTNATTGSPVTAVNVGDTIVARFTHQDIRDPNDPRFPDLNGDPANKGLFASYIDVVFSNQVTLVNNFFTSPTETFRHGPTYKQFNAFPGQFPTIGTGRIEDLGGLLTDVLTIPGPAEFDLVSMAFRVNSANPTAVDDDFNVEEGSASNRLNVLQNDSINSTVTVRGAFANGSGNEVLTYLADDPQTNPDSQKVPESEIIFPTVNVPISNVSLSGLTILNVTAGTASVDTNNTTQGSDDTLLYTPPASFAGLAEITYRVGDGAGTNVTATATVVIGPVNDPPRNNVPGTQSVNEDTQLAFSSSGSNAISVSDPDAGNGTIRVDLGVLSGRLNANATPGVAISGANSNALRLEGMLTNVNTALGTLTYIGNQDFNGQDRLVVVTNDNGNTGDGGAKTDTDTVTINVQPVNDAPINNLPAAQTTDEDTPLIFSTGNGNAITITDVDAGANNVEVALNVTTSQGPNPGTLTLSSTTGLTFTAGANGSSAMTFRGTVSAINAALANNSLTYTPAAGFLGSVTLGITTNDLGNSGSGGAKSDTDTLNIDVEAAVLPRARNDSETVAEDSGNTTITVLNNDLPSPGAQVTLVGFSQGTNGGSVLRDTRGTSETTDDRLFYSPAPHFFGSETFTYTINDTSNTGADNTATVFVTVTEVNDAPDAVDDLASTNEDIALDIATSSVLSNDLRGPNEGQQTLTVVNVSTSLSGATATLDGNTIRFTPPSNFNGQAIVSYTIRDNGTTNGVADPKEDTANITITVKSVNDAPVATNDPATTAEDNALNISAASLVSNDSRGGGSDENGQTLTVTAVSATSANGGTVSLSGGNIVYTPAGQFNGTDTFTYTVSDNGTSDNVADPKSATGTVTVTVTEVNDVPVVTDDSDIGIKNMTTSYQAATLLANDLPGPANESSQTLVIDSVTATSQQGGTVTLSGQTINYTPPANYTGADVITYLVRDNGTTNGVADPKTAVAHLNLNVLDFVPSSVSGHVYIDANNDGSKGAAELAVGGVEVRLVGTDFRNIAVDIPVRTNQLGFYEISNIAPGNYRIVESSPHMLLDGKDTAGTNGSAKSLDSANNVINDSFTLSIGILGGVTSENNNFGERGLDAQFFTIHELLASTPDEGVLIATNEGGDQFWYLLLDGWDKATNVSGIISSNKTKVSTSVRDTTNALQNKLLNIDGNIIRSMGNDGNGGHVLRFEGSAVDFGFSLAANDSDGDAEGEATADEGGYSEYCDGVDAIMSGEVEWA